MEDDFSELLEEARTVVRTTQRSLPPELRDAAEKLPVVYERHPSEAMEADGISWDTLGLFVGPDWAGHEDGVIPQPPQMLLFLDNLADYADEFGLDFRAEVRTTYLHELGHYLGLDEDDLKQRGLA